MIRIISFLFLLCCLQFCLATDVFQYPKSHLPRSGDNVTVTCQHNNSQYLMKFWYRQGKGEPLILLGYTSVTNAAIMEDGFTDGRLTIKAESVEKSILTIYSVSDRDNAIYYCASSTAQNYQAYFGEGTILAVLGENEKQVQPKVKIYLPNKKEFQEHELISLVCVASGFFPEHVRITWYINDEKIESLYQNVPKKEKDGKFSTSSRLSVTKSQYFNPDNKFRCEAAFVGEKNAASDEIQGELGCGISKESYGRYMNQGKISYIMVLFKSGLYAVIVLAVIWSRKVLLGSC